MRAMGIPQAGAIDKLGLIEVEPPTLGAGQVTVRVVASAINPADTKVMNGSFTGRFLHARTKPLVTGWDFSGVIDAVGEGVTAYKVGDEVFGHLPYAGGTKQGTFAERVVVPTGELAKKPAGVSHAIAAAAATSGLTALQSIRDKGGLPASGGRVLVIGAAGGVGSLAIGVGKRLGAKVTGVCSTYALDFVRELGADEVIDRRAKDPRTIDGPYHVIFDAAAGYSYAAMSGKLAPKGAYVTTLPGPGIVGGAILATFSSKHSKFIIVKSLTADLELVGSWIADGMRVPIDATFPIRDVAKAIARANAGEVRGRLVVEVDNGW